MGVGVICLVVLVTLLLGSRAMKMTLVADNQCLHADHVDASFSAINEVHCSTACVRDGKCQGFCYQPSDKACLLTYKDAVTADNDKVSSIGAKIFFIELKSGFTRRGNKSYRLYTTQTNHGAARNTCKHVNTFLSLPMSVEETNYLNELYADNKIWVLADDDPDHEGVWKNTETEEVLKYLPWMSGQPDGKESQGLCGRLLE